MNQKENTKRLKITRDRLMKAGCVEVLNRNDVDFEKEEIFLRINDLGTWDVGYEFETILFSNSNFQFMDEISNNMEN
jgi:hypothetical protein